MTYRYGWLVPALLLSGQAAAQTGGSTSLADRDTVIVTATGVPQDADQVGQSITILDRDTLERRQTIILSDLLQTTPGVTATRNGGIGGLTSVRIRGAESDQTLVLIDGVRVNDPSSPGGGFNFASLATGGLERVEVLRGPGSVVWGSQALGGVVNVVTRTPSGAPTAYAQVEYGGQDTLSANAGASGSLGGLSAALSAGYLRSDGISSAASGTEEDGYRRYGGTARIGYEFAPGIGIDLRGYYADSRNEIDDDYPPPAYTIADSLAYGETQELYGYAGAYANLMDGRFRNRIAFTIGDINRDDFSAPGTPRTRLYRGRTERYEYQGDFAVSEQLRLIAGAEHEDSRLYSVIAGPFGGTDDADTGITSAYGELIVRPVRQLTLTGGARYSDHRRFGEHTTFAGTAALSLDTGTIVRASYVEGFKAPTLYQLFGPYGTPTLDPEEAKNYEAGIEQHLLDDRAAIGVTWFHRDTRNQIDFDLVSYTYRNLVLTRAEGVEVMLKLRPVDALLFEANYTRIVTENRTPGADFGKDLARRPRDTVSVSADYSWPFGLSTGATVLMVGDSYNDFGNFTPLDGYALVDVRAEIPVGERFAVYGRVENAFDTEYRSVAEYGTPGRSAHVGVRMRLN